MEGRSIKAISMEDTVYLVIFCKDTEIIYLVFQRIGILNEYS